MERLKRYRGILANPQVVAIESTTRASLRITRPEDIRRCTPESVLWWIVVTAFVMAVVTIAVTGKWFRHAQVF